ncbi:hypothetical protein E2320_018003 [Naja naja]|nr:hypothetical protein E2320_018003 [Naja naja]
MEADFPPDRATGKEATSPAAKTGRGAGLHELEGSRETGQCVEGGAVPQGAPPVYQVHQDGTSSVKPDGAPLDEAGVWSDACGAEVEPPVRAGPTPPKDMGASLFIRQLQEKPCPSRCGQLQPRWVTLPLEAR